MTVMKILPQQQRLASNLEDLVSGVKDLKGFKGSPWSAIFPPPHSPRTRPMAPETPLTNVSINMDGQIITMMECMCRGLWGIMPA